MNTINLRNRVVKVKNKKQLKKLKKIALSQGINFRFIDKRAKYLAFDQDNEVILCMHKKQLKFLSKNGFTGDHKPVKFKDIFIKEHFVLIDFFNPAENLVFFSNHDWAKEFRKSETIKVS